MKNVGSTWGKWDFHVHTPYSILNNGYGFDPFDPEDNYHEKDFDEYVKTLFSKAIENEITAIGITDYFMIEGYKRIKEKYLDCPKKLEECFPDEEIRKKVKEIYVFPNVELRLKTFVGEGSDSVNYHVLFSDEVSIPNIENNFFNALRFENNNASDDIPLNRHNIEEFGNGIKISNGETGSPLLVGLRHITVDYGGILKALNNPVFNKKHLITVPVDEDLSKVKWSGRDYPTRKNIYKQCDCYLTSNQKTREWALAVNDDEKSRISEFGSLKPCIWGSDAHSYESMFRPAMDRYCWIKAQPTFEGLLQILCEPATRVMIQKDIPFKKDPHQLIRSIKFNNSDFPSEPIEFNDSLVCIIGGKSTGKSLLLRNTAHAVDPQYAEKQEKTVTSLKRINEQNAEVLWYDGTAEKRKIVYIPQTYLNRTIDDPERATAVDEIISDVLLQEPEIGRAHEELCRRLSEIEEDVKSDISSYEKIQNRLSQLNDLLLQDGRPETFAKTIKGLKEQRYELVEKVDISQEDIENYSKIKDRIEELNGKKALYNRMNKFIKGLRDPEILFPTLDLEDDPTEFEQYNEIIAECPELEKYIKAFKSENNADISKRWATEKTEITETNKAVISDTDKSISELMSEYNILKKKVEQNEQLKNLSEQIMSENEKFKIAKEREKLRKGLIEEAKKIKREICLSRENYYSAYSEYCSAVNKIGTSKSTDLVFGVKIEWRKKAFTEFIFNAFDNRNFPYFQTKYEHNLLDLNEEKYEHDFSGDIWKALEKEHLHLKGSYKLSTALTELFGDWYNIHYMVTSGDDTVADMSPGKKALVLLELLISLKDAQCPILIDQPEDDLDNRSIYNELVKFIKNKKSERQIIVVTHNANVVLGADAEQVIVANQKGKDTPNNDDLRFEYRSGAIEDDYCDTNSDGTVRDGILSRKGIQTQICDILEGGKTALELRRNKYTSNGNIDL